MPPSRHARRDRPIGLAPSPCEPLCREGGVNPPSREPIHRRRRAARALDPIGTELACIGNESRAAVQMPAPAVWPTPIRPRCSAMAANKLSRQLIESHVLEGRPIPREEIGPPQAGLRNGGVSNAWKVEAARTSTHRREIPARVRVRSMISVTRRKSEPLSTRRSS
jgi:hypothetical protein